MSSGTKWKREEAAENARSLQMLCGYIAVCERWEIAGSIRRGNAEVGDVEHIVQPRIVDSPAGLFGEMAPENLLWKKLDALVETGDIQKKLYGEDQTTRWGERYRGIVYRGLGHEFFTADKMNWGAQLAIRTGPPDLSKMLVTKILETGMYRQQGGYVIHLASGQPVEMGTERGFFAIAGVNYLEPEAR